MSCPVVKAIKELHGGYDYEKSQAVHIVTPSGFQGGGVKVQSVCLDNAVFYKTVRKLEYARAELNTSNAANSLSIANAFDANNSTEDNPGYKENAENTVYFERMFKDYYGKNSYTILEKILEPSVKKMYNVITKCVDIIDIMESVCSSTIAKENPDGMSLPTIDFTPEIIDYLVKDASAVGREINKIITYANNLCVAGLRTKIDPLEKFDASLRNFEFSKGDRYETLFAKDAEVAEYACLVEEFYCQIIEKIGMVVKLCQSIIDL